ncbi:MAG: hypothetical protein GY765_37925 [bacterium]|nr:hypothetical protein [bacterium]
MSFETVKDVLDHARDFHRQLSVFYNKVGSGFHKERVKMLLFYLSRHEKQLEKSLADYEKDVSEKILKTWFQFAPNKETLNQCVNLSLVDKENLTVDKVTDLALELDNCLIKLYEETAKQTDVPEVKEIFLNLLEMEKQEEKKLVRDATSLKGL